jgi:hypothetical protein
MAATTEPRVSFRDYVKRRLGPGPSWRQTWRVLAGPFFAQTLSGFWTLWNPVWSWCLHEWFYRPARRHLPRSVAVLLTFVASGLIHNALAVALSGRVSPFTTLYFTFLGTVVVLTEVVGLRLSWLPPPLRAAAIVGYLIGCYQAVALVVTA